MTETETRGQVVSRHYFRRTARAAAKDRNAHMIALHWLARYRVERGRRGPFAWVVRRYDA